MALFSEQSTSDATIDKEKRSRTATAGPLSPADDVYRKFQLNFTIDNIQMELFTGDRDMVNFVVVICNAVAEVHSYYWPA